MDAASPTSSGFFFPKQKGRSRKEENNINLVETEHIRNEMPLGST